MAEPPSDTFNFYISDWNDAPDCATLFCVHTYNLIPDEVVRNTMKMRALKGRQTRTANNTH